ncbi:type VII secretion integral membrane protein EccD [Streptomyces atratus]|uniref:type VII secretion integral membrane protein EccD n=1 Tax=Streptomyces atratus TaxID=1893 RepID=UPI0016702EC1|nr:type VII secretion integral membrane protein EccD [Streptomyces atratus]GGT64307.1 type VII secretion integral membrane protein EccD [Streptomyces atratus]
MSDTSVASLCRLTVRAPSGTIDLAVPVDVPVADLLPTLLRYCVEGMEEEGLDHGGWVLQRLGGPALDDEATLEAIDLHDGEVLHLRPRAEEMPEVRLDDLVEGIADITRDRLQAWTPDRSRQLLRGFLVCVLVIALGVLAWPGGPVVPRAATAGVAGLLLLAGAATAARAVGDAATGAALGVMAVPALALAGWLLPDGEIAGPHAYHVLGARLLAAGTAGAGAAVLALAAAAVYAPLFLSTAAVAVAAAVSGALMSVFDVSVDKAAGVVAACLVVIGGFVPAIAFKLAGMRMPPLPTNPGQLQDGIDPYDGPEVATRTELAGGWMIALYGAIGVVCAGCLIPLVRRPNLPEALIAVLLSLILLLHGRGMVNVWQRLVLVVPGAMGAALVLVGAGAHLAPGDRPVFVAGLLGLAAVLAVITWTVPGRRMLPYWGRAAELLQSTLAIGLLPVTLWAVGVFGELRAISG